MLYNQYIYANSEIFICNCYLRYDKSSDEELATKKKGCLMQKIEREETVKSRGINSHKINVDKVSSPVLARLIEEVRNKETSTPSMYNRFHNRHNRS
jgi:hypothetical protein